MTKAVKHDWAWAKRQTLAAYKKALKAGKRGDWKAANEFIKVEGECAFCRVLRSLSRSGRLFRRCRPCAARWICRKEPDDIAASVIWDGVPANEGIARLEATIKALEELEV